ncbi:hypothetical protein BDY17DRAFT_300878 [Neohortaea acidophila]|uniref:Uncharacterized protein n=1 Tax=Neohortaea acidophila TaxID=245834 RepID=A0A6A6PMR9_9PEZI|nr:uncharacterized protein BDY17DRAFT_300878 [Neohortaea acidophila]KAF2481205.1 hypothetical protein BDY17DRAFT_300878 [Neohortaea acidophila]
MPQIRRSKTPCVDGVRSVSGPCRVNCEHSWPLHRPHVESLDRQSRSKMPYAGLNCRLCILGIPTGLTYVNFLNSSSHLHVLPAFSSLRSRRRATLCRNHIIGHECRAVRRHHPARTCPSWRGSSSTSSLMCRCPLQPYDAALPLCRSVVLTRSMRPTSPGVLLSQ